MGDSQRPELFRDGPAAHVEDGKDDPDDDQVFGINHRASYEKDKQPSDNGRT